MTRRKAPALSRRGLITAAAAAPLLAGAGALPMRAAKAAAPTPCADDSVVELARKCLALHRENERLIRRWGRVEAWLADNHDWFKLTEARRRALPAGRQLYDIEDRVAVLAKERPRSIRRLRRMPATSVDGVIGKLQVVAAAMEPDEFPSAYRLLQATISDLRQLRRGG
jgi:hypothetical protein